ncbi:MAG: hypothetical protein XD81_1860 [Bacteroidetes bacterium 38_7]|nr:MAG: hypothetical protein XD81_1860 [Bacteroidetes bacterium 38_7]HAL65510.1 hypothetical protein [Bacteroidales bacterium]
MKNVLRISLGVVIIVLAYFIYDSIMTPLRFERDKNYRYGVIIEKLKDIREIEKMYKNANKKYCGSFDTLFAFARTAKIPVVRMIPDPTDTTFTRSITDTIGYALVYDSLFGKRENFRIEDLAVNPFNPEVKIKLEAGFIDKGGLKVPVFMASALNVDILKGLDEQLIRNLNASLAALNKFPGLKVGSMTEVSIDGNWE